MSKVRLVDVASDRSTKWANQMNECITGPYPSIDQVHKEPRKRNDQIDIISLLFQHHFRSSLCEDSETTFALIQAANDCAHRLALRVEGEDFEQGILGPLLTNLLIGGAQIVDKSKQCALRLVSELGR